MKQLQNSFTTPEQSQRLLDLGVPVKSADCYYMIISGKIDNQIEVICNLDALHDNFEYLKDYFPCWSVGRLIEIAWIFGKYCLFIRFIRCCLEWVILYKQPFVEAIIEYLFKTQDLMLDFSKLEE